MIVVGLPCTQRELSVNGALASGLGAAEEVADLFGYSPTRTHSKS